MDLSYTCKLVTFTVGNPRLWRVCYKRVLWGYRIVVGYILLLYISDIGLLKHYIGLYLCNVVRYNWCTYLNFACGITKNIWQVKTAYIASWNDFYLPQSYWETSFSMLTYRILPGIYIFFTWNTLIVQEPRPSHRFVDQYI